MFCSSCGTKNSDEHNFCRQCGYKIEKIAHAKISEEAFDRALPDEEQKAVLMEHAYDRKLAGDLPGAIALAEEALVLNPNSAEANSLLGQLYESLGDRDNAASHYEKVVALNPGSIADRMKLDIFKNEAIAHNEQIANKVLMIEQKPTRSSGFPVVAGSIAAVGVIAVLSGLLYNAQKNSNLSNGTPVKTGMQNDPYQGNARNAFTPVNTGNGVIVQPPLNAPQNQNAANNGFASLKKDQPKVASSSTPPPVKYFYYPLPANGMPPMSKMSDFPTSNSMMKNRVASKTTKSVSKQTVQDEDEGSGRIRLQVSGEGGKAYDSGETIKVTPKNLENSSVAGANSQNDKSVGSIKIRPTTTPPSTRNEGEPAGTDSNKMIALGEEKMNQAAYSEGIAAFRKAAADANDQLGYVYSRLAKCYEMKDDKLNALSFYKKGEGEYRRLIKSGIQLESSKDGLRICQNGITICSAE